VVVKNGGAVTLPVTISPPTQGGDSLGLGQKGLQGDPTSFALNQVVGNYGIPPKRTSSAALPSCETCTQIQAAMEENPLIMVGVVLLVGFVFLALLAAVG
jgi:hypothetical protein